MQEPLTWILIALVSTYALASRRADQRRRKLAVVPSAAKEVDPTRWRHDGTQPVMDREGNRRPLASVFETENELMAALAF